MNGHRTLLTAMTLTACLTWAGDAMAQLVLPDGSDLTCEISARDGRYDGSWFSTPSMPTNGASVHWGEPGHVWFNLTIRNGGAADAFPFHSDFRVMNNGVQVLARSWPGWGPLDSLKGGSSKVYGAYKVPLTPGVPDRYGVSRSPTNKITASASVDIGNTVTESNETNNQCNREFTVVIGRRTPL